MVNKSQKNNVKKGKPYAKPAIKLETNMMFMFDAIKKNPSKIACRQCSSCHGCR
jgi:hypothetical protein